MQPRLSSWRTVPRHLSASPRIVTAGGIEAGAGAGDAMSGALAAVDMTVVVAAADMTAVVAAAELRGVAVASASTAGAIGCLLRFLHCHAASCEAAAEN